MTFGGGIGGQVLGGIPRAEVESVVAEYLHENIEQHIDNLTSAKFQELQKQIQKLANAMVARVQELSTILNRQASRDETLRSEHAQKLEAVIDQLQKVESTLDQKPNYGEVPSRSQLEDIAFAVNQKANRDEVCTLTWVKEISSTLDQKANRSEVPTEAHMEEIRAAMAQKPNRNEVPTREVIQELAVAMVSQTKELKTELAESLSTKLNRQEIGPLNIQIQDLAKLVERKPNRDEVPSVRKVQQLMEQLAIAVDKKPDREEVPTRLQVEELASAMVAQRLELAAEITSIQERSYRDGPLAHEDPIAHRLITNIRSERSEHGPSRHKGSTAHVGAGSVKSR